MTPKFDLCPDFCTMHLPLKFRHPVFTRSEVIMLTNTPTSRQTRKQTHSGKTSNVLCYATMLGNVLSESRLWVTS